MKRLAVNFLLDHWAEIIVTLLFSVAFGLLLRITNREELTQSDLTQVGTLMVLVIVTVSYAAVTHRIEHAAKEQAEAANSQAQESQRAVEAALRAERNSVKPIVDMLLVMPTVSSFQIDVSNVGVGPALNLEVMLIYEGDGGDYTCESGPIQVLGAGQMSKCDLDIREVPQEIRFSGTRYQLLAIYEDIYGQRFRSWAFPSPDLTQTGLRFTFEQMEDEPSLLGS